MRMIYFTAALTSLMSTMCNVSRYNDKHEHGLLTLQAILTSDRTKEYK